MTTRELLQAAKTLKDFCQKRQQCGNCIYRIKCDQYAECMLGYDGFYNAPFTWDLDSIEEKIKGKEDDEI